MDCVFTAWRLWSCRRALSLTENGGAKWIAEVGARLGQAATCYETDLIKALEHHAERGGEGLTQMACEELRGVIEFFFQHAERHLLWLEPALTRIEPPSHLHNSGEAGTGLTWSATLTKDGALAWKSRATGQATSTYFQLGSDTESDSGSEEPSFFAPEEHGFTLLRWFNLRQEPCCRAVLAVIEAHDRERMLAFAMLSVPRLRETSKWSDFDTDLRNEILKAVLAWEPPPRARTVAALRCKFESTPTYYSYTSLHQAARYRMRSLGPVEAE